jgi:hypothetical protein
MGSRRVNPSGGALLAGKARLSTHRARCKKAGIVFQKYRAARRSARRPGPEP